MNEADAESSKEKNLETLSYISITESTGPCNLAPWSDFTQKQSFQMRASRK